MIEGGRIFKYHLPYPEMAIPIGPSAQILTAAMQGDEIVIWAVVDEEEYPDPFTGGRQIVAVNTGFSVHGDYKYIDTVTSPNGIVWHIFEVIA